VKEEEEGFEKRERCWRDFEIISKACPESKCRDVKFPKAEETDSHVDLVPLPCS
jgi:hypothetical protein